MAKHPDPPRRTTMTDESQDDPATRAEEAQDPVTTADAPAADSAPAEDSAHEADSAHEVEAGHVLDLPDIEVVDEFSHEAEDAPADAPQAPEDAPQQGVGADELAELLAHEPPSAGEEAEASEQDQGAADAAMNEDADEVPDVVVDAEATSEASAAVDAAPAAEPVHEEPGLTQSQLDKVHEFLDELKGTLVEMAQQQPAQQSNDLAPLVEVLQSGFDRSAEHAAATSTALTSIGERVNALTDQVERVATHKPQPAPQPIAAPTEKPTRDASQSLQTAVITAVVLIVLGWSVLFWIKADSPRLALGTLIGANAVACCMLLSQRNRG